MIAKRLVFMLLSMLILPLGQADVSGEWSVEVSFDADMWDDPQFMYPKNTASIRNSRTD
jgi:hypothetical protein